MSTKQTPVNKNQTIELTFEDITHDGNGVGKINGYPIFVTNVLPGEKAKVKVIKVKKNFAVGRRLELIEASPDRVEPPCNVFYKCGGCQLQHMSYDMQLKVKQNQVKSALAKFAHITDIPVEPTLGMEDPWRYRNKVQIPVGEKDGKLITGFYRPRSHDIIDEMERCIVTSEVNDDLVDIVREIANELGIPAYNEETHRGVLRHIMVRTGENTGQTMLVIITRTNKIPKQDEFIQRILEKQPNITSIMHNVNPDRTNVILGKKIKCLWGEAYIYDTIGDVKFAISALSFYQINPKQTKVLYDKALEYANLTGGETVIDAYCGIGSISLFLAQKAKKVYGVEIVPQAIQDAKKNAKLNDMDNTEFIVGQAEEVMPAWKENGLKPDVIVVDPPRKGCDEALLHAMVEMNPKRIVYVSCNPSTFARDLVILTEGGYKLKKVQPVDMFPQTSHVECVALMSRMED
ncbi:23S rRNA (uracil(1939)-C(5))-methyltransferase RlmD [Amphibacillus xylanus]|uniref:Putative RNA methyltransferase n=1 Tax=Amphibacillus xylanus (strain ATCC 51415 / DSM 6626 / JCM 7361 / LMG 17667 / NBRC 15112 / Ep01) TaxID=698758 RepID=K0J287_AMPXN|nr:23S rRNA (uracil(1939)-C(5))-methyltransferase RlmD [Amphibacillus xylanus]BAM46586.1 putative RNA methyltransferase [Amphibacillus xylanus NBRC 15112]